MLKYIFGPVPSRRLGISLGIDLVMTKTCNLDCIYCECGNTTKFYNIRDSYVDLEEVIKEIKKVLKNIKPDYITFSGSGEPTLNKDMGKIIDIVRGFYSGKIAVITNSTLLSDKQVRRDLEKADLIIPSLDAISEDVFNQINRPIEGLSISKILEGLKLFLKETKKEIYLEIFIIEGINDGKGELGRFIKFLKKNNLEKISVIQLNTLARPGTINKIVPASIKKLEEIKLYFEENKIRNIEIIKKYTARNEVNNYNEKLEESILSMLNRRKYSLEEMEELLKKSKEELFKYFNILQKEGKVKLIIENDNIYLKS